MWEERERVVKESLFKSVAYLAWPAVASTMFSIVFEVVDMFWVGRLGAVPVAALSAASFCVWTLRALALTVATGALAVVSRRVGEGRPEEVTRAAKGAIYTTVIFAALVAVPTLPILFRIFDWIQVAPEVGDLAQHYTLIFLSGIFFVFLMVTGEHVIRGMGDTRRPMVITGIALLLNAVLDPLFIFVFKLGLAGAAYATVLSQFVGCVLMVRLMVRRLPQPWHEAVVAGAGFLTKHFNRLVRIGLPVSLSGAAFSSIYLGLTWVISHFGTAPLAALGIGHRLEAFPYFISLGFSMTAATLVGQNLGAGQPERARQSVTLTIEIATGVLAVFAGAFLLFGPQLYGIFISDPEVIRQGVAYIRIVAVFEIFLAAEVILEGAFAGAGDTKPPFIVIFPLTLLRIPLAYLFAIHWDMGITAVWWVVSGTTFLKGTLLFLWFRRGNWMHKTV